MPCGKSAMNELEELEWSPWRKFITHRIVPWRLLLLIVGVCSTTWISVLTSREGAHRSRGVLDNVRQLLFPAYSDDYHGFLENFSQSGYFMFTQDQLVEDLSRLLDGYWTLPGRSVPPLYTHHALPRSWSKPSLSPGPPSVTVVSLSDVAAPKSALTTTTTTLRTRAAGEAWVNATLRRAPARRALLAALHHIEVLLPLGVQYPESRPGRGASPAHQCAVWPVSVTYSLAHRAHARVEIWHHDPEWCEADAVAALGLLRVWLALAALGSGILHLVLTLAHMRRRVVLHHRLSDQAALMSNRLLQQHAAVMDSTPQSAVHAESRDVASERGRLWTMQRSRGDGASLPSAATGPASASASALAARPRVVGGAVPASVAGGMLRAGSAATVRADAPAEAGFAVSDAVSDPDAVSLCTAPPAADAPTLDEIAAAVAASRDEIRVAESGGGGGAEEGAAGAASAGNSSSSSSSTSSVSTIEWADLSWGERWATVRPWDALGASGDVLAIAVGLAEIEGGATTAESLALRVVMGLACALQWAAALEYLEYAPDMFTLIATLRTSVPQIMRFMVEAAPLFLGYTVFGTVVFGDHVERFGSLDATATTLFAVLNGDVMRETYLSLLDESAVSDAVAMLYLFTFLAFFMYTILKVALAMIEEALASQALIDIRVHERRRAVQDAARAQHAVRASRKYPAPDAAAMFPQRQRLPSFRSRVSLGSGQPAGK